MSSACPKCGAVMSMGQNIDKHVMKRKYRCNTVIYDVNGKFLYHESDLCRGRGRAERQAELDAKVGVLVRALSKIADCTDDENAADCATDALYKWREVRP